MKHSFLSRARGLSINLVYSAAAVVWLLLVYQTVQLAQQQLVLPKQPEQAGAQPIATPAGATAETLAAIAPLPLRAQPTVAPTVTPALSLAGHPKTGRYIAAWLPPSFSGGARASFEANKDILDEISPFWYGTDASGRLYGTRNDELVKLAHEHNILVIPSIHNIGDYNSVVRVLANPQLRARHVQNIVDEVLARNYDGIDIDYESLDSSLRASYTAFIVDLAEALHAQGKLLTVAVHAKASDWGGLGGYQDWKAIGQHVDRLRIMTYDYHWRGGGPGPVAPLYWVREVAEYAATVVNPRKIVIGVPFYGYDWPANGGSATALAWGTIEELIEERNLTVNLKQLDNGKPVDESWFTYSTSAGTRTVYFSTQNSLDSKLRMLQDMDLAGIAIWQLGYEDPKNWVVIRSRLVEDPFVLQRAINPLLPEH
jgi:spore germination protein YaaH